MNSPQIEYVPLPDATPESELWCLVNVYAFLLEVSQKHKAVEAAEASEIIEQDLRPGAQQAQGVPEDDPSAE
jgi:hypothetical protein